MCTTCHHPAAWHGNTITDKNFPCQRKDCECPKLTRLSNILTDGLI